MEILVFITLCLGESKSVAIPVGPSECPVILDCSIGGPCRVCNCMDWLEIDELFAIRCFPFLCGKVTVFHSESVVFDPIGELYVALLVGICRGDIWVCGMVW